MTGRSDVDVAVIGGGPAGATVATRLAQLGHRVLLVDRGGARRSHRWETLGGGVVDLLELTGAAAAVREAGFRELAAIELAWNAPPALRALPPGSLLVDRVRFDGLLREGAEAAGVDLRCPAVARAAVRAGDGWRVVVDREDSVVSARFVVDASGRPARPGRAPATHRSLGVTGTWFGDVPAVPTVVAVDDGWVWSAPADIPSARPSCEVTVFVDPRMWRSLPGRAARSRYLGIVRASGVVGGSAQSSGRVRARDAGIFLAGSVAEDARLRVGDAALALDPLSSSGVLRATQSALTAAIVVHTALTRPGDAALALDHHRRMLADAAAHHTVWTSESYASVAAVRPTPYWLARAGDHADGGAPGWRAPEALGAARPTSDQVVRRSPMVRFVETTRVLADRIGRGEAIEHPGLDGAVAFVGDTDIVPLLRELDGLAPLGDLVERWSQLVPPATADRLAGWMWERGLLERAEVA